MIAEATLFNLCVSVVLLACMYSLVNMGFVLLYRTTGVPNFAQGQIGMFAGFVAANAAGAGTGYFGAAAIAIAVAFVSGYLIYRFLMHTLLGAKEFAKAIVTFMLAIGVTQGCLMVWGTDSYPIAQPTTTMIHVGGGTLPVMTLATLAVTILLVAGIAWFLDHTITGTRLQALAENESLSIYAGISVHRLAAIAWAISFMTAGVAGVVYSQRAAIDLTVSDIGLIAFPAAVIGGLNSIPGTFVGSVSLALIQTMCNYVFGGSYGTIIVYVLMLVVLVLKPQGLMGFVATRRL